MSLWLSIPRKECTGTCCLYQFFRALYMPFMFQDGRINYDEFVAMMRKNNQGMVPNGVLP